MRIEINLVLPFWSEFQQNKHVSQVVLIVIKFVYNMPGRGKPRQYAKRRRRETREKAASESQVESVRLGADLDSDAEIGAQGERHFIDFANILANAGLLLSIRVQLLSLLPRLVQLLCRLLRPISSQMSCQLLRPILSQMSCPLLRSILSR